MPLECWDALVRGDNCPLCDTVATDVVADEYPHTVTDVEIGRLRLSRNQYLKGYGVLICKRHVCTPRELARDERTLFFEAIVRSAQALERGVNPDKMNHQMLGNSVPHLRCHRVPRYCGDPAPDQPIRPDVEQRHPSAREYSRFARAIRREIPSMPCDRP